MKLLSTNNSRCKYMDRAQTLTSSDYYIRDMELLDAHNIKHFCNFTSLLIMFATISTSSIRACM